MFDDRTEQFTDAEFAALQRNADGDIIHLSQAYPWISDDQREHLSEDDWSRMIDMDEELACLVAEFA
jgi:hypothetical protein